MRFTLSLLLAGLMSVAASAQTPGLDFTWYARGSFGNPALDYNGGTTLSAFDDLSYELDFVGGDHWTVTVPGLLPNTRYEFKIGDRDYAPSMPTNNGAAWSNDLGDDTGQIVFHMYDTTTWSDGWLPNNRRRVGYDDSQSHDWEVMGSFNGFTTGLALTDMGNGLHSGLHHFNNAGALPLGINYKIRRQTNWDTSIGGTGDFSNSGGDPSFTVPVGGADVLFELDLPNGKWRAAVQAPPQAGDHNLDGSVDAADFVMWAKTDSGNMAGYNAYKENFAEGIPLAWVARSTQAGNQTLVHQGGTLYTAHYDGLIAGNDYEFQVVRTDLSTTVPGSVVKIRANAAGEIDLNFNELIPLGWEDGWQPNNEHRLGYVDSQQYGWSIVGNFYPTDPEDWPATNDPNYYLTEEVEGTGLHTGTFTFATPGDYSFKFRHITADQVTDPAWSTSIGQHFGNNANDINFSIVDAGEQWTFELDLPNGRWRAFEVVAGSGGGSVPEPTSLVMALVVGLVTSGLVRRR